MKRRHHVYALVTEAELETVRELAQRDGLSMSNFIRRAINAVLLEQGDDVAFLSEPPTRRGRPAGITRATAIGQ